MDPLDARQILQALVQGFDPVSGAELPAGTVVQRAEVIRALLAGITALEANALRSRRRAALPENVGRPWSEAEEARLSAAFRARERLPAIAARHRRTVAAIEARLERLGLLAPEERTTRNRYVTRNVALGGPATAAASVPERSPPAPLAEPPEPLEEPTEPPVPAPIAAAEPPASTPGAPASQGPPEEPGGSG